jgi:iron complex transport system substrate-binding protein
MIKFLLLFAVLISAACQQQKTSSTTPRYVITSPEVAEIVYLLNGGESVVGVTSEIDYPLFYDELPKVGRFGAISLERIIALNPTLVFTSGLEQEKLSSDLNKADIETMLVYPQSIEEMLSSITRIAAKIGIVERGKVVADSLRNEIEKIRYGGESRPSVFVEIYGNPVMSISENSFIGELVTLAGGKNIFSELPREYSRIRQEEVIIADPEIIIVTYPGVTAEQIKDRKGWQNIKACQNKRIYTVKDVNPDLILRAGPRVIEGLRLLQELFHGSEI